MAAEARPRSPPDPRSGPDGATNGSRTSAGSGGNGSRTLARWLPCVEQRVDVLEVAVGGPVGDVGDRPVESKPGRGGRRPPARRNGCTSCSARGSSTCRAPARRTPSRSPTITVAGRPTRTGSVDGGPIGALGYTPLHLHRCVRRLPVTGLGFGCARPGERRPDEPSRRGHRLAILAIVALGLVFRLIIAYGSNAPRLRVRVRPRPVPVLGRILAEQGPVRLLRPRLLRRLHARLPLRAVGGRASSASALGRHRRPDQAAGDPRRRRARLPRLLDGPRARRQRSARRCSPARSCWSTRSPGSTASSGARSTPSASCSCCSALRELWRRRPERAAILAVVAALVKPQLGDPRPDRRLRPYPARPLAGRAASATRRTRPSRAAVRLGARTAG